MTIGVGYTFRSHFLVYFAAACMLSVTWSAALRADINGDPAILKLVAEAHQANKDKLLTWSGRVRVTDREELDGRELRTWGSNVVFLARNTSGQLRWNWAVTSIKGESLSPNPPVLKNGLVTEDQFFSIRRYRDPTKLSPTILIQPTNKVEPGGMTFDFIPMSYFDHGYDTAKHFLWFFDNAKALGKEWTVSKAGDIITLRCQRDMNKNAYNEYAIDLGKGATLARYSAESDSVTTEYVWTYNLIGGVWAPSAWMFTNSRLEDQQQQLPAKQEHVYNRTIHWEESKVNEPIADAEFTIEKLEIQNGEWVTNELTKDRYRYDAGASLREN